MRRSRFSRRRDWNGNIARMNQLIDEDMARRQWAAARDERHPGDAQYARCSKDRCQERSAGGVECTGLCVRANP